MLIRRTGKDATLCTKSVFCYRMDKPQPMGKLRYWVDVAGVAVFASSGALAGMAAGLDLLGVVVIASVTAIGGGTIRDLLLNQHPVFWIGDSSMLFVILCSTVFTVAWIQVLPVPKDALLIVDALGVATFAMSGARLAIQANSKSLVTIFMGTLTGVGGGVMRDVLTNEVPFILRQDIYATAAIAGVTIYLLLRRMGVPEKLAFALGIFFIAAIRLTAFAWGLQLPSFKPIAV
jgi:uncharacterized membrane protein YeiH